MAYHRKIPFKTVYQGGLHLQQLRDQKSYFIVQVASFDGYGNYTFKFKAPVPCLCMKTN